MRIHVIAVVTPGAETPWIAGAWDEYSIDENSSGYERDSQAIEAKYGPQNVRVGIVHVPDSFLNSLFKSVEITASKVEKA